MNVAKEKLSKKCKIFNFLDDIPPKIETKTSSKKKRVCKRVRSSISTAHCNEKDFIHPPLPVRCEKNKCTEFQVKRPKVPSHPSAPPNASYLKLTKSFFGSESFATLRANILRSQKTSTALDETCYNFEPQFTSTPNTTVNNHLRQEVLENNIRKKETRKLHHKKFLKEQFGRDELAMQRISKFLAGDSNVVDPISQPKVVQSNQLFGEPTLVADKSISIIDKTFPDASLHNELPASKDTRGICSKCRHSKHLQDSVNYLPLQPSEFQNDASQSAMETYSGIGVEDLFKGLPSSYEQDSSEILNNYEFSLMNGAEPNLIFDQGLSRKSGSGTTKKRQQEVNVLFKDVADVTGFNQNHSLQPKILDDSFAELWETQVDLLPAQTQKKQMHHKKHLKVQNSSDDSNLDSENCPVCKTPYSKQSFDSIPDKTIYPWIKRNSNHHSAPPIRKRDLKKARDLQIKSFDETEIRFENLVRHYSSFSNFSLHVTDDLWKPYDFGTSDDTLLAGFHRQGEKAAKKHISELRNT